jgi:aryl-alcohol dehydrogenase-like predicted oxidoreductase
MKERSDPEYIFECCEKSLKRMSTNSIDLYYCHRVDRKVPIEKIVGAMVELKRYGISLNPLHSSAASHTNQIDPFRQGKINHIGLSEVSVATIRRAHAVHPIAAYQVEYNPFCLDIEHNEVLSTCRELGIAVIAYSPIGRGFLTGQIKSINDLPDEDFRKMSPKNSPKNFVKMMELTDKFQSVADKYRTSAAQVGIAWVLAQGEDVIPIPGTRTKKWLEENTKAAELKLSDREVAELREAAEACQMPGDRYPSL